MPHAHNEKPTADTPQLLAAVLVAGGSGTRLGGEVPKQFQDLEGLPLFVHSLRALSASPLVHRLVLVVPAGWEARAREMIQRHHGEIDAVVPGGDSRQASVLRGVQAAQNVEPGLTHVLIHDAARPFVNGSLIRSVVAGVHEKGAATLAVPVSDTLMRSNAEGATEKAAETVDRTGMWAVQTPQVFALPLLLRAHEAASPQAQAAPDDGSLVLALGVALEFVQGAWWNLKVTRPDDFARARIILKMLALERDTDSASPGGRG